AEMEALGLVERVENRMTPVARAERSRAIIEYRLSDQWFVKMKPLAEKSLPLLDDDTLTLAPERWEAVFRTWLVNTRDWCISRQIWWGHQIPAWYHRETGEVLVDLETPERVKANPAEWRRDEDVLDTWFSSALWPYSTLGWPEQAEDLQRYYPTSVLSTAKDIIYFWVARMVMTGMELQGQTPFRRVYFHPVICDANGETMSKSKGNGIDPLAVMDGATAEELKEPAREARPHNLNDILARIEKNYPNGFPGVGSDALRFTLLSLNSSAQQVQISLERFEDVGKRFIEKLWNATRFTMQSLNDVPAGPEGAPAAEDRWILGRLDFVTEVVRGHLEQFEFSDAVSALYRFFYDDFCDWYVELSKARIYGTDLADKRRAQLTLAEVLHTTLRLLHPIVPFITEELWAHLRLAIDRGNLRQDLEPGVFDAKLCAVSPFPKSKGRHSEQLDSEFRIVQEVTSVLRGMRVNAKIPGSAELAVMLRVTNPQAQAILEREKSALVRAARLKSLDFITERVAGYATGVWEEVEIFANLREHLDVDAEKKRNEASLKKIDEEIVKAKQRLDDEKFMARAPAHVREQEEERLRVALEKRNRVLEAIAELSVGNA
ncbi:MAG: class I tRNA ligase family protein, partial [Deltaproteobacteria bacterium]|nr:class I tRNA ligase family protein [Deltaproteobacteria bacterium]